jgi:hypothetical protein
VLFCTGNQNLAALQQSDSLEAVDWETKGGSSYEVEQMLKL